METKTLLKDDFHILIKFAKTGVKAILNEPNLKQVRSKFSEKELKDYIKKLEFEDAKLEMEKYED